MMIGFERNDYYINIIWLNEWHKLNESHEAKGYHNTGVTSIQNTLRETIAPKIER